MPVEMIYMGCAQAVLLPDLPAIYPELCLPVGPFKIKDQIPVAPVLGDLDLFLIPGGSHVSFYRLQPEGYLYISHLPVRGISIIKIPGAIHDLAGPDGMDGYVISHSILCKGPGQADGICKPAVVPLNCGP